ncbi:hypothetical protein ACLK2D_04050 [Escherichia coli]
MSKSHPRWRLAKKLLTWLFFIAVIVLLVVYAKKVKLGGVTGTSSATTIALRCLVRSGWWSSVI